jgi:NAD(P)-dependent dehydrogenase (short-subunit alcohol dehydrogenase family)
MTAPLAGRVALVTGAAGAGIGRATARRLSADGAAVAVTDVHERRVAEAVEAIGGDTGGVVVGRLLDVGDRGAIDRVVADIGAELGTIDILINNAAINTLAPLGELEPEDWDRVINVNLSGPWYLARAVLPGMIAAGRGVIVNMSSVASWVADLGQGVYGISKIALRSLTTTLAHEYGPHGVRCVAVAPGIIRTRWVESNPEQFVDAPGLTPLRRLGEPAEVADLIAFLVSDAAGYVTGTTFDITGGRYLRP